jgi:hypothetical protein
MPAGAARPSATAVRPLTPTRPTSRPASAPPAPRARAPGPHGCAACSPSTSSPAPAVAAGCESSPSCRIFSPGRPSSPTLPARPPPRRPAPPHPRPPHSRSPRLSSALDAAPTAGAALRCPPLDLHPTPAQDTWGQWAIAMPTLTFAPSKHSLRVRRRVHGGAQTWSDARCPRGGGVSRSYALMAGAWRVRCQSCQWLGFADLREDAERTGQEHFAQHPDAKSHVVVVEPGSAGRPE